MTRVENRGEKAIRAKNKALRCAESRPESLSQLALNRLAGERAEAEAEEMMEPNGRIIVGPGEMMHDDPRETGFDNTLAVFHDTLEHPNMISVNASEERMEAAYQAGVLEMGIDAAITVEARNSLEKMLAHQMAAAHRMAMSMVARNNDRLAPAESARLANTAGRLMQVFQSGLQTLHKIRTGGKQVMVVQRVQVSEGGQAVVAGQIKASNKGSAHEKGK